MTTPHSPGTPRWPSSAEDLVALQEELGAARPTDWEPNGDPLSIAACFASFAKGISEVGVGARGDKAWAAAVVMRGRKVLADAAVVGRAPSAYSAGLLALREGPVLEAAVRLLDAPADVVLVNATGRDHPRRAGLAVHLGAVLDMPTVGVTHRPLCAAGGWPDDFVGARAPLFLEDEIVGYWLRTRAGARPVAVHAGWRTGPDVAVEVVTKSLRRARTPEPLRRARRTARLARASIRTSTPMPETAARS